MLYTFIDREEELSAWAEDVANTELMGFDTEFFWERTYFPQLCLIQIAAGDSIVCIDTLNLKDLTPLKKIMKSTVVKKVFHAAKQDIEVLHGVGLESNEQLLDTQIAGGLLGMADQIGYGDLVEAMVGVRLEKSQTRTDWISRPLTARQLDYAANDVKYLCEMTEILSNKLAELGRLNWWIEDCLRLQQSQGSVLAPWDRVSGIGKLDVEDFEVAVKMADWRESKAKEVNLPRGWVISDKDLLAIVLDRPKSRKELSLIMKDKPNILRKFSDNILQIVSYRGEKNTLNSNKKLPLSVIERKFTKEIKKKVVAIAEDLAIGANVLCTSKEVDACMRGEMPERISNGWRKYFLYDLLEPIQRFNE
jgi:ribonuclease D